VVTNLGDELAQLGSLFTVLSSHSIVLFCQLDHFADAASCQVQLPLLGNAVVVLRHIDHQTVLVQLLDIWPQCGEDDENNGLALHVSSGTCSSEILLQLEILLRCVHRCF